MHLKYPDLLAALSIVVIVLVIVFAGGRSGNIEYETMPTWTAPMGILMVLFVPGYSVVAWLLPDIGSEKTLLLSLGISLSLSALGGILLNLTPWGLNVLSWSLWLCAISLIGIMFAWLQRRSDAQNFDVGLPHLHWENIVIFGLAGFILLGAVLISRVSSRRAETTFTQLWAIPSVLTENRDDLYSIQIGVRNEEQKLDVYSLYAEVDGRRLDEWDEIRLEPGHEWITTIKLYDIPVESIQIYLYRVDDMKSVYRWLRVSPDAFR